MKLTTKSFKSQKGFTLIELLVVIGILAILLAITLVAINPAKQFGQSNDTKRRADINSILNAINQYMADNNGQYPSGAGGISGTLQNISNSGANLCSILTPTYLAQLPADPTVGNPKNSVAQPCPATYDTGYQVVASTSGRITVTTTTTYAGTPFSVTR